VLDDADEYRSRNTFKIPKQPRGNTWKTMQSRTTSK
jgi:hypothetical protein